MIITVGAGKAIVKIQRMFVIKPLNKVVKKEHTST